MLFRLSTPALALVLSVLTAGSTLGAAARDHRAALAMFLLGQHVGFLDRGVVPLRLAAGVVTMLLSVTFDLDRPTRGFLKIPDIPLVGLRASMSSPPPASPG